jgi:hypothetical protein
MKTFVLAWEEYLDSANQRVTGNWQVLCSGQTKLATKDESMARKLWKRMFPQSKVLSITQHLVLDTDGKSPLNNPPQGDALKQ